MFTMKADTCRTYLGVTYILALLPRVYTAIPSFLASFVDAPPWNRAKLVASSLSNIEKIFLLWKLSPRTQRADKNQQQTQYIPDLNYEDLKTKEDVDSPRNECSHLANKRQIDQTPPVKERDLFRHHQAGHQSDPIFLSHDPQGAACIRDWSSAPTHLQESPFLSVRNTRRDGKVRHVVWWTGAGSREV